MNTIIIAITIGIIFGAIGGFFFKQFLDKPTEAKKHLVLNYLVYAVALAEQAFGAKTGKLRLAKVYNEFVVEMPALAKIFSYEAFCNLVDEALVILRNMLQNQSIEEVINGVTEE